MGLFDQINFAAEKTADSTYDTRLLDTSCDHRVRDEQVNFDVVPLLTTTPYSGNSTVYNSSLYSGGIEPTASTTFKTKFPYVNDGAFSLSQSVFTDVANPIVEEFVVADPTSQIIDLKFPPKTNTVTAKQKLVLSNNEITFIPFNRYNLFQLYGQIEFNNSKDIGSTIIFEYLADKKRINPLTQNQLPNYRFEGLDSKGFGIFTIYGRSLLSTSPSLFIRYKTIKRECPKCAGAGQLNDLLFDQRGRLQLVYDFSKLIQDYFKRLYTLKGTNPFDAGDGSDFSRLVGLAISDAPTLESLVRSEMVNLLFKIREKQKRQSSIQGIGLAEQIAQINSIEVRALNATDLSVRIEVLSKSGKIEQIGSIVSLTGGG